VTGPARCAWTGHRADGLIVIEVTAVDRWGRRSGSETLALVVLMAGVALLALASGA
jgi:uncharacterized membrane protein